MFICVVTNMHEWVMCDEITLLKDSKKVREQRCALCGLRQTIESNNRHQMFLPPSNLFSNFGVKSQ